MARRLLHIAAAITVTAASFSLAAGTAQATEGDDGGSEAGQTEVVCVATVDPDDVKVRYDGDAFHATVKYTGPTLCAGASATVSLNSYQTQGPTWPSSGTQKFVDHAQFTIDAAHLSGTMTVDVPACFFQTDLYWGDTTYDGTDGPIPHYNDVRIEGLIDSRTGGEACQPPPLDAKGSFTVRCDADGAVVTVGQLSNEPGVTWEACRQRHAAQRRHW